MTAENVLVTGGNGFIGSALVDKLLLAGHNVFVIDDLSTGVKENSNLKAEYSFFSLLDCIENQSRLEKYLMDRSISTVYHLAASADIQLSMTNPEKVYAINLLASISLFNICEKTQAKKFVFASTSAVYGPPKYLPVDENHSTMPISPYGLTKLNFEQYLSYRVFNSKLKATIFRFPNVYGPRQREDLEGGVIAIFRGLIRLSQDLNIYGDGTQTRDWVYVDDIVEALLLVFKYEEPFSVFNLGAGHEISLNDFIKTLRKLQFFDGKVNYLEERVGDIKHMALESIQAQEKLLWKPKTRFEEGILKVWQEL